MKKCLWSKCAMRVMVALFVCLQAVGSLADEVQDLFTRWSAVQERAILSGTWRMVRPPSAALDYSQEIVWKEICFSTNGLVSIVMPGGDDQTQALVTGTYELYNRSKEGWAPRHEIHVTVNSIQPAATFVLYKVRTGEFSCFPRGMKVLWAKDEKGKDCVFEAVECNAAPGGKPGRMYDKKHSVDRGRLKLNDFDRILTSVSSTSNGVCVVAKDGNVRYFVILNDKEAMNVQGETPISVPAGGSLKLVSRDSMLCLKALETKDDSLLWQFDVELKFVNVGESEDEIMIRSGILAARKNDQKIVVLTGDEKRE